MRVLITGGCSPLGIAVVKKFIDARHDVSVIDFLPEQKDSNNKKKYKYYNLEIKDKRCEKVFEANSFEVVIYVPHEKNERNIAGLVNILNLSIKTGVKRFMLLSSVSVYGKVALDNTTEKADINISSSDACWEGLAEYYCSQMNKESKTNIVILRLSNLYGPGLSFGQPANGSLNGKQKAGSYRKTTVNYSNDKKDGNGTASSCDITSILNQAIETKKINIDGSNKDTCDLIYIDDAADAIFKVATLANISGIFNISSNEEISIGEVIDIISKFSKIKKATYSKSNSLTDIRRTKIDNSRLQKSTGFKPSVTIKEGIEKTVKWKNENRQSYKAETKKINREHYETGSSFAALRPVRKVLTLVENLLIFLVFAFLQYGNEFFGVGMPDLRLDYLLIYIILVGILWGQVNAYLAMILASTLFIGANIYLGADMITFFYAPENLLQLALYLLVGIITGYTIERKNREIDLRNDINMALSNKYSFLLNIYNQMKLVKNELQSQVIETEDSFSTIYNIIQEVDSLEIEKVFAGAINAIERIMKTDKVSIYVISRNGGRGFMRLKARSAALNDMIPNSIKIDESPCIKEVIKKKRLYVNKNLDEDMPVMTYPIIDGEAAIGVASIHETEFENLTRRYENLFITVMGLISNALKRAYFFEESLKDKRFIPGTRILIPEIFEKVLAEIKNYKEELGMSYSLLEVSKGQKNYRLISERISSGIRENDYIGLSKKGDIYILLSNTNNNYAGLVVERLETKGIKSKIKKEELADELPVSR